MDKYDRPGRKMENQAVKGKIRAGRMGASRAKRRARPRCRGAAPAPPRLIAAHPAFPPVPSRPARLAPSARPGPFIARATTARFRMARRFRKTRRFRAAIARGFASGPWADPAAMPAWPFRKAFRSGRAVASARRITSNADHQVSRLVQPEQHFGPFAGPTGILQRHAAAVAHRWRFRRGAASVAEHRHAHTLVSGREGRIERHVSTKHIFARLSC